MQAVARLPAGLLQGDESSGEPKLLLFQNQRCWLGGSDRRMDDTDSCAGKKYSRTAAVNFRSPAGCHDTPCRRNALCMNINSQLLPVACSHRHIDLMETPSVCWCAIPNSLNYQFTAFGNSVTLLSAAKYSYDIATQFDAKERVTSSVCFDHREHQRQSRDERVELFFEIGCACRARTS